MSPDNENVAWLKYAICLNIDISTFPTVWAVLSIFLDTQDSNLEYVNFYRKSTKDTMRVDPQNTWRNWRRNQ